MPVIRAFAALLLLAVTAMPTLAQQSAADFYKGKTIDIIVGYGAGGGYDLSARTLVRYMPKYMAGNPQMVVRNMPGAGSVLAANSVNNVQPKDGTVIGEYADLVPAMKVLNFEGLQFDPKEIQWLGAIAHRETPVLGIRSDAPATTIEAMKTKEVLVGSDGPGATSAYAFMLNDLVGTKIKVLTGYSGTQQIDLAVERGEVHGRATIDWPRTREKTDWLARKLIVPVVQFALEPSTDPDLKTTPLIANLAKTDADKQVLELVLGTNNFFRAFSVAPGVPKDRVAALREAFAKTMTDKEFQEEFLKVTVNPVTFSSPDKIVAFMDKAYKFPEEVIKRAAKYATP
jgi:tripartite-type tricarboxylate transporter receptor subunit TctC